ncbi:MAG: bifunctional heptose 7-phosphate kinase/heptose 1-phosphate adenyltransferase [Vicinamibacteria bacterium]
MKGPTPSADRAQRLESAIEGFWDKRVLVVADLVADEYLYGRVRRVSREAPVLILQYEGSDLRLGGGANAAHNIRTLGALPVPVAVLGQDAHGKRLKTLLREREIPTSSVFTDADYATPVKTRVLAGNVHTTRQQVVRIDRVAPLGERSSARQSALRAIQGFRGELDAVLVSDYGLGLVTPELVEAALRLARSRRVPITIDSRYDLLRYRGMTAVTPNEPEVEAALGVSIGHDRQRLEAAGRRLLRKLETKAVLITRGSHGMALFEAGRPPLHIPIHGGDEVADVTGAGDTVIATFTLALAAGAGYSDAAQLANYAGGVVVMKRGTATVSAVELREAVKASLAAAPAAR